MNKKFNIEILSFENISEIDNAWNTNDYKSLLAMMDIDEADLKGMSGTELKEMCLMSLSDYDHAQAAKFVLTHIFKASVTPGKIDQLSYQMAEEKMWEEYADASYHMSLFNAYSLLRKAYNGTFAKPTGVRFTVKISANKKDAFEIFDTSLYAIIVRLLSCGLDDTAILNRLYEEQIAGNCFEEAENILWILKETSKSELERYYEITSSDFWFEGLQKGMNFEALTHGDVEDEDED